MFKDIFSSITSSYQQAVDVSLAALKAPKFINDHRLWKGFFDHKWVSLFSIAIAFLFSYLMITNVMRSSEELSSEDLVLEESDVVEEELYDLEKEDEEENEEEEEEDDEAAEGDEQKVKEQVKKAGRSFFFSGGMKYLLLIFLEVLIFHFSVKTYSILKGKEIKLHVNDFYKAEIRMLQVMFQSLIKTWLIKLLITIFVGIVGFKFLKAPALFFVYSYFIGHAFLDNYNEQHALSIKDSSNIIKKRLGASTALGVIASVIMLVPLIGPLTAPLFCAVIATLYGYRHKLEAVSPD